MSIEATQQQQANSGANSGAQHSDAGASSDGQSARWLLFAACRGLGAAFFYPEQDESVAEAKAVCARCPVTQACLDHAIASREKDGIWGGLDAAERERYVRRRRRALARSRKRQAEAAAAEQAAIKAAAVADASR